MGNEGEPDVLDLASIELPPERAPEPSVVDLGAVERAPASVAPAPVAPAVVAPAVVAPAVVGPPLGLMRRFFSFVGAAWTFLCGCVGLVACLAVLAALPVLQLCTLGWLLEAEGRLGRTGRLRGVFPGVTRAARIGSALLGLFVVSIPWLVVRGYAQDARLLEAGSSTARALASWTWIVGAVTVAHAALAVARGGRFPWFFRPLSNWIWAMRAVASGPVVRPAVTGAMAWVRGLRLDHYLALGAQGLVAGFAWLAVPTGLLALGGRAPLLALIGAALLVLVLPWLLAAQAHLAAESRFGAAFELREVRRRIARAPLASAIALVVVLGLALPLYLLKIEPVPRDALWLPAAFFIVGVLPGRIIAGWAYSRGARPGKAHPVLRLAGAAIALPAAGVYVFVLFFSQFFSWYGDASLIAHHAFLLPVAFY